MRMAQRFSLRQAQNSARERISSEVPVANIMASYGHFGLSEDRRSELSSFSPRNSTAPPPIYGRSYGETNQHAEGYDRDHGLEYFLRQEHLRIIL